MKLVLQCAMCGTHHPVGTRVCSTCRASGVTQLRLMFECPSCGGLDLNPVCETCPAHALPGAPDEDLIVAEEVSDEPLTLDDDEILVLDLDDEADENVVVDWSDGEFDDIVRNDLGDDRDDELDSDGDD